MKTKIDYQKGFLSILAIILIIIVALIGISATYQFTTDARISANQLASQQAFYMAQSGLEAAQHTIIVNGNSCTSINGAASFTNQSAPFTGAAGVFLVTGAANAASTTLNGSLTAAAVTIPLISSSNFAASGVVSIDSELINYTGLSGNSLTGITRGAVSTTAAAHASGASVVQNQCTLTSTGSVPNAAAPLGKRILQKVLQGGGAGFSIGTSSTGGALTPAMVTLGSVSVTGNSNISNTSVTSSSANFSGSTIISPQNVVFNGSGSTTISNNSGSSTVSSYSGNIKGDVLQNSSKVNSSNLFGLYFNNKTKAYIQSTANQSYTTANSLSGVTGKTIWFANDFNPSGNITIGSAASPVILIITGNTNINGNITIYGFFYAMLGISMNGGTINGAAATENALNLNGSSNINFNAAILKSLNTLNSNFGSSSGYLTTPASLQEIFP